MSCIFVGQKTLTTEKNHICVTVWTDVVGSENLILFFFFWPLGLHTNIILSYILQDGLLESCL